MRRLGVTFSVGALLAGLVAACGESESDSGVGTGGSGTGGVSTDTGGADASGGFGGEIIERPDSLLGACRAYVMAQCLRREECAGTTTNRCEETADSYCPDLLFSEGSTRTLEGTLDCADEWETFACADALVGRLPACVTPGTRQPGETCVYSSQCESLECSAGGSSCGVCLALAEPGGACSESLICPPGETCEAGSCVASEPYAGDPAPVELDEGEFCSPGECAAGLTCVSNDERTENVCRAVPDAGDDCWFLYFGAGNEGQVCSEWEDTGVYCDSSTLTCTEAPLEGETCGERHVGSQPVCAEGSYCNASGTCEKPKGPGEACLFSPSLGSICAGSVCDESDGICKEARELGESCGADRICEEHTLCEGGVCVADDTLRHFVERCE